MNRRVWMIALVTVFVVLGAACSFAGLVDRVASWLGAERGPLISVTVPTPQRATPYPTLTPQAFAIPGGSADTSAFRLELGEDDISEIVSQQDLAAEGFRIRNVRATITPDQVIATFDASHAESGLSGEITVVAVPRVVEGALYLQIVDFSLGRSFSGFTRLIATGMVQTALDQYSTANGIPVPIPEVEQITSVELSQGSMVVTGVYP